MTLLHDIKAFCLDQDMAPTRFGTEALRDPRLLSDLEDGRELRVSTEQRVRQYMAGYRPDRICVAAERQERVLGRLRSWRVEIEQRFRLPFSAYTALRDAGAKVAPRA